MSTKGPKGFELYSYPRQLRNLWFAELSRAMDGYMRSAAFLDWMRYALTAMTEAQALQARSLAGKLPGSEPAAHSLPTAVRQASTDTAEPARDH